MFSFFMARDTCCLLPTGHAVCSGTLCDMLRICSGLVGWYLVYCLVVEYGSSVCIPGQRCADCSRLCFLKVCFTVSIVSCARSSLCMVVVLHSRVGGKWCKSSRQVCIGCKVGRGLKGRQKRTIMILCTQQASRNEEMGGGKGFLSIPFPDVYSEWSAVMVITKGPFYPCSPFFFCFF